MKLLDKILLATDFSKSSENIVDSAIRLSKIFQSRIILLHVLPKEIKNEKVEKLVNEAVKDQLRLTRERIENEDVEVFDQIIDYGSYCDRIVFAAELFDVNVILIGSGVKTEEDEFKLGTTADKIIRKSNKPVWIIKNDVPLDIKKILCPVDFAEESERAIKNAIILAHRLDAELVIFSVSEMDYSGSLSMSYDWKELKEYMRIENDRLFDKFLNKINLTDLNWKKETKSGNPSVEILDAIKRHDIDLLVMGTSGKTGINRYIMGSVTSKVIREIPCSFITLKSEDIIDLQLETKIQSIEIHGKNAKQLINDGLFEEAIKEFKMCLLISDIHIPSLNGIAISYDKLKRPKSATKYRNRAKDVLARLWDSKIEADIRKFYKF